MPGLAEGAMLTLVTLSTKIFFRCLAPTGWLTMWVGAPLGPPTAEHFFAAVRARTRTKPSTG